MTINSDTLQNVDATNVNDHIHDPESYHELQIDNDHYDQIVEQEIAAINKTIRESSETKHLREAYKLSDRFPVDADTVFCDDADLNAKVLKELAENRAAYSELKNEMLERRQQQNARASAPSLLSFLKSDESALNSKYKQVKQTKYIDQLVHNTNKLREQHFHLMDTYKVAKTYHDNYLNAVAAVNKLESNSQMTTQDLLVKYPALAKAAKLNVAASKALVSSLSDIENNLLNKNTLSAAHIKEAQALQLSIQSTVLSEENVRLQKDYVNLAPMLDNKHVGTDLSNSSPEVDAKNKKVMAEFAESFKDLFSRISSYFSGSDASQAPTPS